MALSLQSAESAHAFRIVRRRPGRPISVVYAPTRFLPKKIRVMIDFLVEITRTSEAKGAP